MYYDDDKELSKLMAYNNLLSAELAYNTVVRLTRAINPYTHHCFNPYTEYEEMQKLFKKLRNIYKQRLNEARDWDFQVSNGNYGITKEKLEYRQNKNLNK